MSSYGTEFELSDADDDELYINRCCNEQRPLMMFMGGGRYGVELFREDVERLAAYLASIVGTVPARPQPEPAATVTYESAGSIRNGYPWWTSHRVVCRNTIAEIPAEP